MTEQNRELIICRCEDITLGEIQDAIDAGCRSIKSVKRFTRAGMGACQGRTCGRMIAAIISQRTGISKEVLGPDVTRFPCVPLPLSAFGTMKENTQ